ncbi:bifunctional DNA primase/polymerase [Pseudonocardia sp. 73-21]|uniref:bifunctional DNA primase/polymerase n=1 Tax=Pseudonocardia sp. 73-21 TaxID=1895809 RepID=UPI0009647701|nr:bifunctional DNA primase/polymerase [Pseudonocardia sp. 73-21]OJY45989.1 MAG: hypothetical protein BGP03_31530 [Pseudonocardia sp. 73-21]
MREALRIADEGMAVFPLRPNSKVPALGPGWQRRATRDPQRIRMLWSARPFNIGAVTGGGIVAVDLDAPKTHGDQHGRDALSELARDLGQEIPRETRTVATPGGGLHLYMRVQSDVVLRNSAGMVAPRVDIRADGGYVVGPGSRIDGRSYRITDSAPAAPMPNWLLELLRPRPSVLPRASTVPVSSAYVAAVLRGETEAVARAVVGTRNVTLFRAAARLGTFVGQQMLAESVVIAELERACVQSADFGIREIRRTIRSGLDRANRPGPRVLRVQPAAAPNRRGR